MAKTKENEGARAETADQVFGVQLGSVCLPNPAHSDLPDTTCLLR